ncbi:trypsin-like peptidase domain-containing protein [Streptomyces sp. S.PB5]|uniref:nSTAND1 domain-containing NTPase n=1 Tax=Streptomyces sp. S.PB5 TaxID=3020844 RepID=UPI0025B24C81|nr:trypsin-like peptidase domain-containing protein [Streptomyces sp. S.PB5]MDN3027188.1 trypsin-like peptidase domain-containing protein [Streptomyces sp. S.PB5]
MEASGAAIVRFRTPGGTIVGHGVLVDDEHIVTCAHVVNAALDRPVHSTDDARGRIVRLEFPLLAQLTALAPERRARVDAWEAPGTAWDGLDVAGLTLVGEPRPVGAIPIPLAHEDCAEGEVLLFGPVEGRPGGWVSARLRPLVKQHRQQIDQRAHGAHMAQPRYSGTPVLDAKAERALGLLVATAADPADADVYAIPVSGLVAAWPAVFAPLPASPYKGLEAFGPDDAHLFFGRDAMAEELVAAVEAGGLVPVVGASGAGKSSLVQAGLVPRLVAGRTDWRFITVRPRPQLTAALAAGFARAAGTADAVPVLELEAWQSRIGSIGLAAAGDLWLAATGGERLLLVVDQFEEAADGSPATDEILSQLAELAVRKRSATVAVLTLREDAFGRLFLRPGPFGEVLRRTAVALRGMEGSELAEAIVRPALLRGLTVHDRLVHQLASLLKGRPGALPLLEFTLDRMWTTLQRGQDTLSYEGYAEIGELDGALAEYADSVLTALAPEERSLVRRLFLNHLISPDQPDVRRVAVRSELRPAEWAMAVRLANERLLTTNRSADGEETVEVVHEALLSAWGSLASWLKEEEPFRNWRRMLAYAMRRHDTGEESAAVLSGPLLADSQRWLAERPSDITVDERRFINASLEQQDREERRYRTLFEDSLVRTLILAAQRADDARTALMLAAEALERSAEPAVDTLVRSCLRRMGVSEREEVPAVGYESDLRRTANRVRLREWAAGPPGRWTTPPGATRHWVLGDEDTNILIDERGAVRVRWNTSDGDTRVPLTAPAVIAACTDTATAFCLGTEEGKLHLYQITDSVEEMWHITLPRAATCVAIDSQGSKVAVSCDDGITRVLSAQAEGAEALTLSSPGFVDDLDFAPDGLALAVQTTGDRITVWDLTSGERRCDAEAPMGHITFSADGDYLVSQGPQHDGSGTVLRLPLHARRLATLAHQVAGRQLTDDEWQRLVGMRPLT